MQELSTDSYPAGVWRRPGLGVQAGCDLRHAAGQGVLALPRAPLSTKCLHVRIVSCHAGPTVGQRLRFACGKAVAHKAARWGSTWTTATGRT